MAASPVSDLPDASLAISTPELKTYIRNLGHSTGFMHYLCILNL